MRIAVGHLKVFDDLALVPDVIAGGHHVNPEIEELFRQRWSDAEPRGRVFTIGDDKVDGVLLYQIAQALSYDRSSRTAKNVADKKNVQNGLRCQVLDFEARLRINNNLVNA